MPELKKVQQTTYKGKNGFSMTWMMMGFTRKGAQFKAKTATAMRFPSSITNLEVIGTSTMDERDYDVSVFVPTEGFMSAGIKNPLKWLKEEMPDRALDF